MLRSVGLSSEVTDYTNVSRRLIMSWLGFIVSSACDNFQSSVCVFAYDWRICGVTCGVYLQGQRQFVGFYPAAQLVAIRP